MFLLGSAFRSSASPGAKQAPQRDPKCKIDIANGKEKDCYLKKANDDRIAWYNSSPRDRSVHFKPNDNPFTGNSCWDVPKNTPSTNGVSPGPIDPNAAVKSYTSYTSYILCADNPPSTDGVRGTPKVIIQP
jgi:hypothetical protein